MSELRDYQRVFVDSIIDDFTSSLSLGEAIGKIESRIESYDRERKEQYERDLPSVVVRAISEYIL